MGTPPIGLGSEILGIPFGNEPGLPLQLQWSEGIQTEFPGAQNSAENPDSLGWKRSYAPFVSADGTEPSQVGNQTRPPHSEPQPDPPLGSWGSGLGGNVQYGSRGGANPNDFGRDPTEFGQLIYDPPPEYPLSARTPPSVLA